MDIIDDSSHPVGSPPAEEACPLQTREEKYPLEPIDILDLPEPGSPLSRELAQSLVNASEAREAKIRELQDAIKNGTYSVCDEQIADKMLRDMLLGDLP